MARYAIYDDSGKQINVMVCHDSDFAASLGAVLLPEDIERPGIASGLEDPLPTQKAGKIAESKAALAEYLAGHPLTWTDGKAYSVTEEKQSLLMGNIAAYQIEVQSNPEAVVTWNATGEVCVPWDINELCALAVAIKNYVKPLVSYQQAVEVSINDCETLEALEAVTVDYASVHANE